MRPTLSPSIGHALSPNNKHRFACTAIAPEHGPPRLFRQKKSCGPIASDGPQDVDERALLVAAVIVGEVESNDSERVALILDDAPPLLRGPRGARMGRNVEILEVGHGLIPPQPCAPDDYASTFFTE